MIINNNNGFLFSAYVCQTLSALHLITPVFSMAAIMAL